EPGAHRLAVEPAREGAVALAPVGDGHLARPGAVAHLLKAGGVVAPARRDGSEHDRRGAALRLGAERGGQAGLAEGAGPGLAARRCQSMKSVVVSPARKAGLVRTATRKSRLVTTPGAARRSRAPARRRAASARVGAWAISLAIIGSNSIAMSVPAATPAST